jgi:hypothetical protein
MIWGSYYNEELETCECDTMYVIKVDEYGEYCGL